LNKNRENRNRVRESRDTLVGLMTISLFIILLAFFILLNSIAVINEQRMRAALGSLLGSFGVDQGGYPLMEGSGDKPDLFSPKRDTGRIDFSDLLVGNEHLFQDVKVLSNPRGSMVRIPAHNLFETGRWEIIASGRPFLDRLSTIINRNQYPVEISGHTGYRATDTAPGVSNRELSTVRALNVLKHLIERGAVLPNRITAFGWGGERPLVSDKAREMRAVNRRIDVLFVHRVKYEKPKGGFTFKDFFFRSFD